MMMVLVLLLLLVVVLEYVTNTGLTSTFQIKSPHHLICSD
jgi:hypothetical protein